MRGTFYTLCVALLLLLASSQARAQDAIDPVLEDKGPVRVQAAVSFGGIYRPGEFANTIVDVRNRGPERRVRLRASTLYTERLLELDLPAGAERRVHMLFPTSRLGRSWRVEALDANTGELLGQAVPRLRRLSSNRYHAVAFLGPRPPGLSDPTLDFEDPNFGLTGEFEVVEQDDNWRVLRTSEAELPESWLGYEPLDTLLWSAPRPDRLNAEQLQALQRWVATGGHLVLGLDEQWSGVQRSALSSLLPATLEGVQVTPSAQVALPMGQTLSQPQLPLLQASPKPGVTPLAQQDPQRQPWGWTWAVGDGRVTLWRFTPGRLEQAPGRDWWETHLFYQTPERQRFALWSVVTRDEPPLEINVFIVLLVLGLYLLVIGPVDYLVLRRLRRLEWTLATYPTAILVFAGLTWLAMTWSFKSESLQATTEELTWFLPQASLKGEGALAGPRPLAGQRHLRVATGFFPETRQRLRAQTPEGMESLWRALGQEMYGTRLDVPHEQALEGQPPSLQTVAAAYAMTPLETRGFTTHDPQQVPITIEVPGGLLEGIEPYTAEGSVLNAAPQEQGITLTNHLEQDLDLCWWRQGDVHASQAFSLPAGQPTTVKHLVKLDQAYSRSLYDFALEEDRQQEKAALFAWVQHHESRPSQRQGRGELICISGTQEPLVKLDLGAQEHKERRLWRFLY